LRPSRIRPMKAATSKRRSKKLQPTTPAPDFAVKRSVAQAGVAAAARRNSPMVFL